MDGVYTINIAEDYKFTCKKSPETSNRIVVDGTNTSEQDNINIYLDNVNIKTSAGSALQINNNVKATVTIYLTMPPMRQWLLRKMNKLEKLI